MEEYVEVKCMLEIVNYRGEGAYIAISVIDKSEQYIKTVYVFGDDKSWFSEMKSFWRNLRENNLFLDKDFYLLVDAISGPTISGSERRLFQFKIPKRGTGERKCAIKIAFVQPKRHHQFTSN